MGEHELHAIIWTLKIYDLQIPTHKNRYIRIYRYVKTNYAKQKNVIMTGWFEMI